MQSYVGPYQILRFLNKGSQGSVYLGYDSRIKRRLAIKVYTLPEERAGRRQLLAEAQLVASLDSPKIVQVHDVIESQSHLAMVMEYVPGCNLEDLLRQTRLSLAGAMTVGIDIAAGLAAARQKKIVHGDLKAANVLITPSGRAKLADFGIASEQKTRALMTRTPGSLSALSPEQFAGEAPTGQSDLFALGVLLYRMLTGEHPFFVANKFDPDRLVAAQKIPLSEIIPGDMLLPQELVHMIDLLLARDPGNRPRHTRGLRQIMRGIVREMPIVSQGSLAAEARPFFRGESAEDLPLQVPDDLGRAGRSRMPPGEGLVPRLQYWLRGLQRSGQIAVGVALILCIGAPLWWFFEQRPTTIEFQRPELLVPAASEMPPMFSVQWLIDEVKLALAERVGRLRVVGSFGLDAVPVVHAARPAEEKVWLPEQLYSMNVRCESKLCIFSIRRTSEGESTTAQGFMFTDDSLHSWRETIHRTVDDVLN